MRRIPAATQPAPGQLWVLIGGPGPAGWSLVERLDTLAVLAPGYDLLFPDYRGTGYSTWLGCDDGNFITNRCYLDLKARWGTGLSGFSTTSIARDLAHAIDRSALPGQRVYMFGESYGTYVANRFLSLFPERADAAVLDSVCPATGCDVRWEKHANLVVEHIFEICRNDAFCSGKLGGDPYGKLMALLERLDEGHCTEFFGTKNRATIEELMLIFTEASYAMPVAMATVYRAERCNEADVAALKELMVTLGAPDGFEVLPGDGRSAILGHHISYSEFWPDGLDEAVAAAELAALPLEANYLVLRARYRKAWGLPVVPESVELKRWADTQTPLLLLNGDFDASTHPAGLHDVEASFRNDSQQLVIVPFAGHGVLGDSHTLRSNRAKTCGAAMIEAFYANPARPVDTACVAEAKADPFAGSAGLAQQYFRTNDVWENPRFGPAAIQAPPSPEAERALELLRRRVQERARD